MYSIYSRPIHPIQLFTRYAKHFLLMKMNAEMHYKFNEFNKSFDLVKVYFILLKKITLFTYLFSSEILCGL